MSDPELQAIRARRLAELQAQHGGVQGGSNGMVSPVVLTWLFVFNCICLQEQQKAMQERREKEEEYRNTILTQFLTQEARARCMSLMLFMINIIAFFYFL